MATAKKNNYINTELDWAESRLQEWKDYVDANPLVTLRDRMDLKETKNGGMVKTVIASIEAQGKFIQETMKNYLTLLDVVNKLREQEEAKKIASFGDKDITMFEDGTI